MLDLFAGSGAIGIEALSRGAPVAVFVERDRRATMVIARNLERTRLQERGASGGTGRLSPSSAHARRRRRSDRSSSTRPMRWQPSSACASTASPPRTAGWLDENAIVVAKHFWKDAPAAEIGILRRVRGAALRRDGPERVSSARRSPSPEDADAPGCLPWLVRPHHAWPHRRHRASLRGLRRVGGGGARQHPQVTQHRGRRASRHDPGGPREELDPTLPRGHRRDHLRGPHRRSGAPARGDSPSCAACGPCRTSRTSKPSRTSTASSRPVSIPSSS